jgi:hypothetical protein
LNLKTLDLREAKPLAAPIQGERKPLGRRIDNLPSWSRPLRNQNQSQLGSRLQNCSEESEILDRGISRCEAADESWSQNWHSLLITGRRTAPLTAQSDIVNQEPERVCAVVDLSQASFASSALSALVLLNPPFPPPPPSAPRHRVGYQERGFNYGRDLA